MIESGTNSAATKSAQSLAKAEWVKCVLLKTTRLYGKVALKILPTELAAKLRKIRIRLDLTQQQMAGCVTVVCPFIRDTFQSLRQVERSHRFWSCCDMLGLQA